MTERETIARIIDPDAWHDTLPTDGYGLYWMDRRKKVLAKADAILASLRTIPKEVEGEITGTLFGPEDDLRGAMRRIDELALAIEGRDETIAELRQAIVETERRVREECALHTEAWGRKHILPATARRIASSIRSTEDARLQDRGDPQAGNLLSSLRDQAPSGLDASRINQALGDRE
jgi:hypothetical protein